MRMACVIMNWHDRMEALEEQVAELEEALRAARTAAEALKDAGSELGQLRDFAQALAEDIACEMEPLREALAELYARVKQESYWQIPMDIGGI